MKWTEEKPTKPGWYWTRYLGLVWIQEYRFRDTIFNERVLVNGSYEQSPQWVEDEWAGPIPEPNEKEVGREE